MFYFYLPFNRQEPCLGLAFLEPLQFWGGPLGLSVAAGHSPIPWECCLVGLKDFPQTGKRGKVLVRFHSLILIPPTQSWPGALGREGEDQGHMNQEAARKVVSNFVGKENASPAGSVLFIKLSVDLPTAWLFLVQGRHKPTCTTLCC